MLTYSEIRELVLAGEFVAILRLLLAHRLVSQVVSEQVSARLTPFGTVQMTVTGEGMDQFVEISTNSDGTPAVDESYERVDGVYPVYEDEHDYYIAIDEDTGKDGQAPWVEQLSPREELDTLVEDVCQALGEEGYDHQTIFYEGLYSSFYCVRLPQGDLIIQECDPRSAEEIVEFMLERLQSN